MALTNISTATNVRFRFQFRSGRGNDLYIDDINVGNSSVGLNENNSFSNFIIYPNPTKSSAKISFNLANNVQKLSIKVKNAIGQEVTSVMNNQSFTAGNYTLTIDEERKLASGIYFIELNIDNSIKIQKLIIQ